MGRASSIESMADLIIAHFDELVLTDVDSSVRSQIVIFLGHRFATLTLSRISFDASSMTVT
jgi:hypothetical protein